MFHVGDKIVHPMHGAGVIDSIVSEKRNGVTREYYQMKLPVGGMLVMIPTENSREIGVRPVIDKVEADKVIAAISDIQVDNESKLEPPLQREYAPAQKRRFDRGGPRGEGTHAAGGRSRPFHRRSARCFTRQNRF
jgi:hypothetical protein